MLDPDLQSYVSKPRLLCLPLKGKEKERKGAGERKKKKEEGGGREWEEGKGGGGRAEKKERSKILEMIDCYSQTFNLLFVKISFKVTVNGDFPGGPVAKTLRSQSRGPQFNPSVKTQTQHSQIYKLKK